MSGISEMNQCIRNIHEENSNEFHVADDDEEKCSVWQTTFNLISLITGQTYIFNLCAFLKGFYE